MSTIQEIIFPDQLETSWIAVLGRLLFLLGLLICTFSIAIAGERAGYTGYIGERFLHLVNTPFHEAGHVFFRIGGQFLHSLGGTLGQLLMPLICMGTLLLRTRDAFGASVCFWWFAENFADIAPYINDARAGVLPLLGGNTGRTAPYGFHDWEYLLNETGLLQYDTTFAQASHLMAILLMCVALAWGGWIIVKQTMSILSD
jgi:hypothetical protein